MPNPVVHFEVSGKDRKRTEDFYASLFGWGIQSNDEMAYVLVDAGGGGINGGISQAEETVPLVTFYVQVDDAQKFLDKAIALGGRLVRPVIGVPGSIVTCQFADPDGNVIGIVQAM